MPAPRWLQVILNGPEAGRTFGSFASPAEELEHIKEAVTCLPELASENHVDDLLVALEVQHGAPHIAHVYGYDELIERLEHDAPGFLQSL